MTLSVQFPTFDNHSPPSAIARRHHSPWIALEKVHGSNFCFVVTAQDDGSFQVHCCKRSSVLAPGDRFFGFESLLMKHKDHAIAAFKLAAEFQAAKAAEQATTSSTDAAAAAAVAASSTSGSSSSVTVQSDAAAADADAAAPVGSANTAVARDHAEATDATDDSNTGTSVTYRPFRPYSFSPTLKVLRIFGEVSTLHQI